MIDRFWRLLPGVRRHERRRFLFFAGLSLLVTLGQTLGLVGSEALFLARFGVASLPQVFLAASLLTVAGSFLYAVAVGHSRNDTLFFWMLAGSAVAIAGAAAGANAGASWVLPATFCLWYLLQAVFLNHFLTFAVDYFDAASARRLFPLFTLAASLGGALGGLLALLLARAAGPVSLVAGWALVFGAGALMLRLGHRPLRRWGPLDLEEADETSVESMRGALRYLRGSALGRALVLSALGMVVALFVAQYLYSEIFVRAFPDPTDLAAFFGVYQGVTNLIEIGVGLAVTPWLIGRFGVATSNLIHPLLTILGFGALALHQGLATGIAARANRELVENATGFPIRSLVYNAMPMRLRGRMRAFLEGIVVYGGMSAAGALLLVLERPSPVLLCGIGSAAALVFFAANLRARREYVRALAGQLRAGRLDLADLGGEIGQREASELALLWQEMLREEGDRPSPSLLQVIPHLAAGGAVEPLLAQTGHANPAVRRACLMALAPVPGEAIDQVLLRALDDPDADVRLAALRASSGRETAPTGLDAKLRALANDPAPPVRAEAACHVGIAGASVLRGMIGGSDAEAAQAALAVAPAFALDAVMERVGDPDPAIRAAALAAAARTGARPLSVGDAAAASRDPDPRVRRAALWLLAGMPERDARLALGAALADPASEVARDAERLLGTLGPAGAEAALPHLHSECERAVEGAMRVLAVAGSRGRLAAELRRRATELWVALISFQELPDEDDPSLGARFLRAAYQDWMMRSRRLCFTALELLEDRAVIRKVERSLRYPSTRLRGDALEVLMNLGDRIAAHLLALVHEQSPLEDRIRTVRPLVSAPGSFEAVIDASLGSDNPFVRRGARAAVSDGAVPEEDDMQRLLALKQVPLFSQLSLEQLEAVLRITREEEYSAGEVIFHEGDPGGALYLPIEGTVGIYKAHGTPAERLLHTQPAGSYFGEMAILDDAPRSAAAVATGDARLLCLDGESLKDLILQMPQLSFEIFRVLTARVRAAEAR